MPTASPAQPARRSSFLRDERAALASATLAEALSSGLVEQARNAGDPRAAMRVARMAQMAGRRDIALSLAEHAVVLDSSWEPDAAAVRLIDTIWGGVVPAAVPAGEGSSRPAGRLLETMARVQLLLCQDRASSGLEWAAVQGRIAEARVAADAWLEGAHDPVELADGTAAALQLAMLVAVAEHPRWTLEFLGTLRFRLHRARHTVWIPILDFVEALPAILLGRYVEGGRLLTAAIGVLRSDPLQPWHAMATASRVGVAALTRTIHPADLAPLEAELTEGQWRACAPYARLVASAILGRVAVALGDGQRGLRLLSLVAPLDTLGITHGERVLAWEWAMIAEVRSRRVERARRWRDAVEALYDSATRNASLARMDLLLGVGAVPPGELAGTLLDVGRTHYAVLSAAVARGDREQALAALAKIDEHGSGLKATAVRIKAVRLLLGTEDAPPLTPRQHEIAALASAGLTNKQIAAELFLSPRTVETHVRAALATLGLQRRGQLGPALLPERTRPAPAQTRLTRRGGQVAALVSVGCTNAEIATVLGIAEHTVEKHLTHVFRAMGVRSRSRVASAFLDSRL